MASDSVAPRQDPPVRTCGSYRPGHDVHYIQWKLTLKEGPGEPRRIESVSDDGTITFTDGTTLWHHDPKRLRAISDRYGKGVEVGSHGVLRVGLGFLFCVAKEPDPCRPETGEVIPGESLVDELRRRGGFLRSGRSVLAEIEGSHVSTVVDEPAED